MGYTRDVIKGLSWLGAIRIVVRSITFLKTPIIARILTPSQVGLFTLSSIIVSLAEALTETGINIFLVQKKDEIDKYISTAWIASVLRGIIIAFLIFSLAPIIASFFNFGDALQLIQLISVVPLIRGFINPSVGKFIKDLHFYKEFIYRTFTLAVEAIASISLVLVYASPVSLVWGMIVGAIFEVAISYLMARPFPKFEFKKSLFNEVISRGKWLTATGVLSYMYQNTDNLVVGKILGSGSLGLYDYVYKISMLPITEIADVVTRASFPVLMKISNDITRLRRAYVRSVIFTLILALPIGIVFFLFPETILLILLGQQWVGGAEVLKVLAVLGIIRALSISVLAPFYALEKQKYVTTITLVSLIGMGVTILPFVAMSGIVGAGYSALFGTVITLPVIGYYLSKIFPFRRKH